MKKRYFGTDGIRDVANTGNLKPAVLLRLSQALGEVMAAKTREGCPGRVGLGGDTRISYDMIRSTLTAGFTSLGWEVVDFGVLPTPALAHLTRSRGLGLGVMISASHNPMADNGIKVFDGQGFKLPDEKEKEVEALIDDPAWKPNHPIGAALGCAVEDRTGQEEYMTHLLSFFKGLNLGKYKVAVDCANGADWKLAPEMLARLGAKVVVMANDPDGTNINLECGAVCPGKLAELVVSEKCHLGFALDGDGDRCQFVDANGALLNGDHVLAMAALEMEKRGALNRSTVVATTMSNLGLERALEAAGIRLVRTEVGDRYVTARLREDKLSLGGEQSGHLIFGEENHYTGDGVFTALKVLKIVEESGKSLQALASVMQEYPQVLINVAVSSKPPFEEIPAVQEKMEEVVSALRGEGRVILRYSGTEKKARIMVEGSNLDRVKAYAGSLAETVRKEIG